MSYINGIVKYICVGLIVGILTGGLYAQESESPPFAYMAQAIDADGTIGRYNVRVVDVISGDTLFTADPDVMSCALSVSPDGRWLVYESLASPAEYILYDLTTGTESILNDSMIEPVRWDDDMLFYTENQRNPSGNLDFAIWQYNLADKTVSEVRTVPSTVRFNAVGWFNQDLAIVTFDGSQFIVYRNDDNGLRFINQTDDFLRDIQLSPTTRYFSAFYQNENAVVIDTEDGLRLAVDNQSGLSWYHHSDTFTYINNDNQIVIRHLDSGVIERFDVLEGAVNIRNLYISPDDRYIAYFNRDESNVGGFFILDISTGSVYAVGENNSDLARTLSPLGWVDATHLVYLNPSAEEPTARDLWMYNVVTGQTIRVTNTPDERESFRCVRG